MTYTLKEGWAAEVEPTEDGSKITIKNGETLFAIFSIAHYPEQDPLQLVAPTCLAAFVMVE